MLRIGDNNDATVQLQRSRYHSYVLLGEVLQLLLHVVRNVFRVRIQTDAEAREEPARE